MHQMEDWCIQSSNSNSNSNEIFWVQYQQIVNRIISNRISQLQNEIDEMKRMQTRLTARAETNLGADTIATAAAAAAAVSLTHRGDSQGGDVKKPPSNYSSLGDQKLRIRHRHLQHASPTTASHTVSEPTASDAPTEGARGDLTRITSTSTSTAAAAGGGGGESGGRHYSKTEAAVASGEMVTPSSHSGGSSPSSYDSKRTHHLPPPRSTPHSGGPALPRHGNLSTAGGLSSSSLHSAQRAADTNAAERTTKRGPANASPHHNPPPHHHHHHRHHHHHHRAGSNSGVALAKTMASPITTTTTTTTTTGLGHRVSSSAPNSSHLLEMRTKMAEESSRPHTKTDKIPSSPSAPIQQTTGPLPSDGNHHHHRRQDLKEGGGDIAAAADGGNRSFVPTATGELCELRFSHQWIPAVVTCVNPLFCEVRFRFSGYLQHKKIHAHKQSRLLRKLQQEGDGGGGRGGAGSKYGDLVGFKFPLP
mmetsp:Transcript_27919/g.45427  ORF Transcript_27919/g.45427 Transcript_27919/m.45427 type:complete len:476 (-) Transcript_27919:287-1714(-)